MQFISSNLTIVNGPAVSAASDNEAIVIQDGVTVKTTTSGDAVFSSHSGAYVVNNGDLYASGYGVHFSAAASDATLSNGAGTTIFGATGVSMEGAGNLLTNSGAVLGSFEAVDVFGTDARVDNLQSGRIEGGSWGVWMNGTTGDLYNQGTIVGKYTGVVVGGYATKVVNDGFIVGTSSVGVSFQSDYGTLVNRGTISAAGAGVLVGAVNTGAWIVNHGSMDSIDVKTNAGSFAVHIVNTGDLEGVSVSGSGPIEVINHSVITGSVEGLGAVDSVRNAGNILGSVNLWDGEDSFNGRGGSVGGSVDGGGGNDYLVAGNDDYVLGNTGADTIIGRGSVDYLVGGAGGDLLKGGTGGDVFVFTSLSDSTIGAKGQDKIAGFNHYYNGDYIDLSGIDANTTIKGDQEFTFIGTAAFTNVAGQLHVTASSTNLLLQGDVNGDGVADFQVTILALGSQAASFTDREFIL